MQPGEVASLRYNILQDIPTPYPSNFNIPQTNFPAFNFGGFSMSHELLTMNHLPGLVTLQAPCTSNNCTSDEADGQQQYIINERKRRRMISNRESARRSRMRKQKHLDELWSQVVRLRAVNCRLMDELNRVLGDHERIFHENSCLKDEASGLRKMLKDLHVDENEVDN